MAKLTCISWQKSYNTYGQGTFLSSKGFLPPAQTVYSNTLPFHGEENHFAIFHEFNFLTEPPALEIAYGEGKKLEEGKQLG